MTEGEPGAASPPAAACVGPPIGPRGRDPVIERRVRLLVQCAAIVALLGTALNVALGLWASAAVTLAIVLCMGAMWIGWAWLIAHVDIRVMAHVLLGAMVLAIASVALSEGTTHVPNLHILSVVVVGSALLLGVRASRWWTVAALVVATLTYGADVWLGDAPAELAANHGLGLAINLVAMHLLAGSASRVAATAMAESARAAELARATTTELENANAALAAALAARSRFLANMSHEIRTPLNAVLGFTDVLLRTSLDAEQRQYSETIHNAGRGLLVIVDDVLDLARIEAGKLDLSCTRVDLAELVAGTLDMLAVAAHDKGLELWSQTDPGASVHALADAARLRQVLLNLVGNAVKFTTAGWVMIALRHTAERGWSRIEVVDTGMGIAPQAHAQLFQPFEQEDASTRRRYGGSGLGLAISKRLVEGMGGRIGMTSEPGRGSCFWVELPYADGSPAAAVDVPAGLELVLVPGRPVHGEALAAALARYLEVPPKILALDASVAELERVLAGAVPPIVVVDWDPAAPCPTALLTRLADAPAVGAVLLLAPYLDESGWRDPRWKDRVLVVHKPVPLPRLLERLARILHGDRQGWRLSPVTSHFAHRVLLVEDNLVNQAIGRVLLQAFGCAVEVASDGLSAVAIATAQELELVLMDLHMPRMDGFEATAAIRAEERARSRLPVPIFALSASVLAEDQARCTEVGMDGHLAKPVSREQLDELLRRIPLRASASPTCCTNEEPRPASDPPR